MNHTLRKLTCLVTVIACLALQSCSSPEEKPKKSSEPRLVKTIVIQSNNTDLSRTFPGKVHANAKVDLSYEISGTIIDLPIHEGLLVKQDQLIARLDPRDYEIKVAEAQARYGNANAQEERYAKLVKTGHVTAADYDQKKMDRDVAKAALDKADKDFAETSLKAPFEGMIANKYVNNHQYVQAKTKIVSLQDSSTIEIHIDVTEHDLALTGGLRALSNAVKNHIVMGYATFPALTANEYPVTLKEYSTEANKHTQTFLFRLIMERPQGFSILPGVSASVRFVKTASIASIAVPSSAVSIDADGKYYVWVVKKNTLQASKHIVTTGPIEGKTIQILSGLKVGDTLIIAGTSHISEGMNVRLAPEQEHTP